MGNSMEVRFEELNASEQKIIIGTIKLIGFVRKKGAKSIVVAGSSAQPLAKLFRALWYRLFPGEKPPRFYALGRIALASGRKKQVMKRLVGERFNIKKISEPIVIMDEFVEMGQTVNTVESILKEFGKKKVYKAALFAKPMGKTACDFCSFEEALPPFFYKARRNAIERLFREGRKVKKEVLNELRRHNAEVKRMAMVDPKTLKVLRRKFLK